MNGAPEDFDANQRGLLLREQHSEAAITEISFKDKERESSADAHARKMRVGSEKMNITPK